MSGIVKIQTKRQYKLAAEFNAHALAQVVTEKLADGWELRGEAFGFRDQFCQVLTKTEQAES